MTGDQFASVVQDMLRDLNTAVSIPLVVSRAAAGDYGPLKRAGSGDLGVSLDLMGSSIWCNEPWVGLDATGPWGTDFDSYTTAHIAAFRQSAAPFRSAPSRARSGGSPRPAACRCSRSSAAPTRRIRSRTSPT